MELQDNSKGRGAGNHAPEDRDAEDREAENREAENRELAPLDRRSGPRFQVGAEAEVFVVGHGLTLNCRVLDLSLRGCRLYTGGRIPSGVRLPVEVTFSINRLPFRLAGTIRRSSGQEQVGVEFAAMSERHRAEWAEVVEEVHAGLAASRQAETAPAKAGMGPAGETRVSQNQAGENRPADAEDGEGDDWAVFRPMPGDERRKAPRFECKGVVEIRVLPLGSKRPGTLLDLSAGGCSIETRDPLPVDGSPSAPVEVSLALGGLNLRVAGVVRHLYEKNRAGVQFTDVSERKAAQIEELVADLIEMDKRQRPQLNRTAAG